MRDGLTRRPVSVMLDLSAQMKGTEMNTDRATLLDRVNCLLTFDQTGRDCETAMALMTRHQIGSDELNARRANPERPIYRPVR